MRTKKGNEVVVKSDITLSGQTLEEVDNFKYLGALITSQNEVEACICMIHCYYEICSDFL
jgi:hypothetical protein